MSVDPERDFTRQVRLTGLEANATYEIRSETESGNVFEGQFRTAPSADQEEAVRFVVTTGQAYHDQDSPDGFRIYESMLALDPDFFVHPGEILYYDRLGKTLPLARWHWQRTFSLPTNREFHRQVSSYFMKDDHDTWMNDSWPGKKSQFMGEFTFDQGIELFLE